MITDDELVAQIEYHHRCSVEHHQRRNELIAEAIERGFSLRRLGAAIGMSAGTLHRLRRRTGGEAW